jgi:hypothetical protein
MIKPQEKICPRYSTNIVDGVEQSVIVADFTVVKASTSLHGDRVLAIVLIKPIEMSLTTAKEQLAEYFGSLVQKERFDGQPVSDHLAGMLVVGNDVLLASVPMLGGIVEYSPLRDITGNIVYNFLRGIAVANW